MSRFTSSMATSWSRVSSNGNASSSSPCHGVSGPKAWPFTVRRTEYRRTSSPAMSRIARRTLPLVRTQSLEPRRCTRGASPPMYLATTPTWSDGT